MSHSVRRTLSGRLFVILCFCLAGGTARAQTPPPGLTAPVNDFAAIIDGNTKAQLDSLIRRLQNATGDVMVVATVKTYQPSADLKSYAVEMFENEGKGIGEKGKDNGVLIVLALDDRQVWIETGYGLEGFITDGFAGETSRAMVPFFREGDYSRGLLAGATRVAERIAQGRNVDLNLAPIEAPRAGRRGNGGGIPIGVWVILLIIFLNMMGGGRRGRGRSNRWISGVGPFGGGFGGGLGGGSWGGGGGFGGGFGGGRSGGGGGGAGW